MVFDYLLRQKIYRVAQKIKEDITVSRRGASEVKNVRRHQLSRNVTGHFIGKILVLVSEMRKLKNMNDVMI